MNAFQIIAAGLNAEPPAGIEDVQGAGRCVVSGEWIEQWFDLAGLLKGVSGLAADTFPQSGYVSRAVAACMTNTWNLGSRVFCADGTAYRPMVSREMAAKNETRPCWSDLARDMREHIGEQVVVILTDDFKKRLWHRVRSGPAH